jgi:hypothetical protein
VKQIHCGQHAEILNVTDSGTLSNQGGLGDNALDFNARGVRFESRPGFLANYLSLD